MMVNKSGTQTRDAFLRSDEAARLRAELTVMAKSPEYNTKVPAMIDTDELYFVEKHMKYMSNHLTMNHLQYVSNLRLMTKQNRQR